MTLPQNHRALLSWNNMQNINWEHLLNSSFKDIKHSINFSEDQYLLNINGIDIKFLKDKNNFIVSPDKWIEEKISNEKIHEPRMVSWLFAFSEVFKSKKIRFYDIGALFGFHSFIFSKISDYSKIITVEGNPLSAQYIKKNVEKNKLQDFDVINCVVDKENKEKIFLIDAFSFQLSKKNRFKYLIKKNIKFLLSSILNYLNFKVKFSEKKIIEKIYSKTIESIMLPYSEDIIEIIKIDTEGHQAIFLPSSTKNLIRRDAIVLLELDDPSLMKSFGSSNAELIDPFLNNNYSAFWTQHRDKASEVKKILKFEDKFDCNSLVTLIPQKFI